MRAILFGTVVFAASLWTALFASDEVEHFKYGSVGIEAEEGLPYWIWQVLPRMFADKLPGGYASLGFVWEPDRELPIGFSKKSIMGSERVAVNCAFCHTATYRTAPDAPRVIVPGGATTIARPQAFSRFLEAAAADPRFNAGDMLESGDLAAMMTPHPPKPVLRGSKKVKRLFADPKAEDLRYYKKNGFFPIMHVVAFRDDVLQKYPEAAQSLFKAFGEAVKAYAAARR